MIGQVSGPHIGLKRWHDGLVVQQMLTAHRSVAPELGTLRVIEHGVLHKPPKDTTANRPKTSLTQRQREINVQTVGRSCRVRVVDS